MLSLTQIRPLEGTVLLLPHKLYRKTDVYDSILNLNHMIMGLFAFPWPPKGSNRTLQYL